MSLNQDCSRNEARSQQFQVVSFLPADQGIPQLVLAERKYDQIMSCTQNDLVEGHSGKGAAAVGSSSSISGRKRTAPAGDVEEALRASNNNKKFKSVIVESSSSPGSNSSEVTTEPEFMAESSKSSSGFDDACTLTDVHEKSGASTSELIHSLRIGPGGISGWDLNGAPVHAAAAAAEGGTTVGVDVKAADEDEDESSHQRLNKRAAQAGKSIEYYSSQDSWLQLGLGPSSRTPDVPPAASFNDMKPQQQQQLEQDSQEYFPVEDHEVDVSRQQKALLHLFPSESVQVSEYRDYRMPSITTHLHMGNSTGTAAAATTPARQSAEAPSEVFYNPVPPVRFREARQQELTGFLRPLSLREDLPDTQLVISYSNTNNKPGSMFAPAGDESHHLMRQSRGPESFGEPPMHPPPAPSSFPPVSSGFPGSFSGYNPPFDSLGFQEFSGKRPEQYGQPSSYSWKHETSPSVGFQTSRPEVDYSPNLHATGSRLNVPPSQPGEDWQSLIKRLGGGNLQFQSLFPGAVTKAPANTSSDHGFSIVEDLQQRRRPPQDFHPGPTGTHWSSIISQGEAGRGAGIAGGSTWSRQLFGAHQDVKPLPFQFPSFQEGSSFINTRPNVWQHSGPGLLPFLPPGFSQQQHLVVDHFHHQQQQGPSTAGLKEAPQRRISTSGRLAKQEQQQQQQQREIWFSLRAGASNQDRERLPQIPKGYLRVKDGSVPVSHVKKYLVHKLGLTCESEVEICCRGQILLSSLSLQHVRDVIWHSSSPASERDETSSSPSNIVMELSYRRPAQFDLKI